LGAWLAARALRSGSSWRVKASGGALESQEELEQCLELPHVVHFAAHHFGAVLDQHGLGAVLEEDVVLRVAALEVVGDLLV
jgi:hypothetical protein